MNVGRRILALSASLALAAATVSGQALTRLAAGQTIDADLKGGGVNVYEVELTAGSFFSATFDQRGADVKPVIIGPDGKTLYDYDGSEYGWEPAVVIAPVTGIYRLEARSARANAAAGRYQLHIDAIRPPTPEDEARTRIGSLESEALVSFRTSKPEGIQHAHEVFERVVKEYQALGDPRGEAHAYRALAAISNAQDDFATQAAYRRKEIALRRQLGDDYGEAEALLGLGIALRVLGETDDSRDAIERSLSIQQAAGRLGAAVDGVHQLASLNRTTGDLGLALDQGYQALAMARRLGDKQREGIEHYELGVTQIALGETEAAIESFRAAAAGDPRSTQQARTAAGIGFALVKLGRDDEAEPLIKQALEFWASRKWRGEEANTLRTLGEMYAHRSETSSSRADLERARDAFEQSAAKAAEASYPASESVARMRLGEVLMSLERLDDAEKALSDALALADRSSDTGVRADVLADQATLALARGDLSSAHRLAEDALTAVESTRAVAESTRVRAAMLASNQRVYEAFVRVLMAEHAASPAAGFDRRALEVSERARARSLLDMVMDVSATSAAPTSTGSALDDLRKLQQRIHGKAQALDEAQRRKLATAPAISAELDELVHQFGLAEARVRRESPDAATVASPEPLTADAIQQQVLDRQTVLVEYMLGEAASYAWVLSQGSLSTCTLARRSEIVAATEQFRAGLSTPQAAPGAKAPTSATPAASVAALSRLLIAPLGRLPAGTRLLIVAPGSLQQVPFGALTTGGGALVAHHEIVHAPSASIVAAVRGLSERRAAPSRTLAVFADPVFEAADPRVTARQTGPDAPSTTRGDDDPTPLARAVRSVTPGDKTLARLPFTRREADAIVALAPHGSVLEATDFEANLRQVMRPSLADYRLLHFATHGLLDTRTPELSGLVFSLVTEQGKPQDGFLRLTDISRLRLNADLAVLSGCDTGRGRAVDGEGVIGLTRGFVIAGARRVVASLWAVDDLATAEFMKRFYREMLVRHRSPSAALASAQRQMAASDRWSAPYFWAGFVIQGEWRD